MSDANRPSKEQRQLARARRRRLTERLRALREREASLELELHTYTDDFYRVCIFGSARIKPEDETYKLTSQIGYGLGELGIDVLTGGGPGLMEAANKGVLAGRAAAGSISKSFGITIALNRFEEPSQHLDIKHHHRKFSSRLDDFMLLSNAIIVVQGGIGTLLELYYSWQLLQVGHMPNRPIILMDSSFWEGLIAWMKEKQLGRSLISHDDFKAIALANKPEEAVEIIRVDFEKFRASQAAE